MHRPGDAPTPHADRRRSARASFSLHQPRRRRIPAGRGSYRGQPEAHPLASRDSVSAPAAPPSRRGSRAQHSAPPSARPSPWFTNIGPLGLTSPTERHRLRATAGRDGSQVVVESAEIGLALDRLLHGAASSTGILPAVRIGHKAANPLRATAEATRNAPP